MAARNAKLRMPSSVDALRQSGPDPPTCRPPPPPSLAAKRKPFAFKLSDMNDAGDTATAAGLGPGRPLGLYDPSESFAKERSQYGVGTSFSNFRRIVYVYPSNFMLNKLLRFLTSDPSGALKFGKKAVLHASGVDFSNGSSFAINMGELDLQEELGRGNYGTVKKVLHTPTKVLMAMKVRHAQVCYSSLFQAKHGSL